MIQFVECKYNDSLFSFEKENNKLLFSKSIDLSINKISYEIHRSLYLLLVS